MIKKILVAFVMLVFAVSMWGQSWSKDLEKSAKNGDVTAQIAVANAYFNGDGVAVDKSKAAEWYYKAAKNNSVEAKNKLYSFYSKELEKLAKDGDAQAQYEIAMDYCLAEEVELNLKNASKWFYQATLQGHEEAKKKLCSFYSKELETLAKSGDAQAQYEVGMDYYEGQDVDKKLETASKWFSLAANQGHADAKKMFYSFYSKELEKAAKEGDAQAQYEVGLDYLEGNGVEKNAKIAAQWLLLAYKQNHEEAKSKLYSFYSVELENVAKMGDINAQYALGMVYLEGNGVAKNSEIAAQNFYEASVHGHADAKSRYYSTYTMTLEHNAAKDLESLYVVGSFYFNGEGGVEKNEQLGLFYLKNAYEKGHPKAMEMIGSRCSKFLQDMAIKGGSYDFEILNKDAAFEYACCYLYGRGVEVDEGYAMKILGLNSDLGHEKSIELFYATDSPERQKREVAYYNDKLMQVVGFNDFPIVIVRNKETNKSQTYLEYSITQAELDSLKAFNKENVMALDVKDLAFCVSEINVDGDLCKVSYYGNVYLSKTADNSANKNDVVFGAGGTFKLIRNLDGALIMEVPVDKFMTRVTPYAKSISNVSNIEVLTSLDSIEIPVQKNVKEIYTYTLRTPFNDSSYEVVRRYEFEDSITDFYNKGMQYYEGNGVEKDCTEAVKWLVFAAFQGNVKAKNALGDCYYYGEGVTQDYAKAVRWFKEAVEIGDAEGFKNLGVCYLEGNGVVKNVQEAVKCFQVAADQGNSEAQCELGDCYYLGEGVAKDYTEAVKWYRKSAEQGNSDAQNSLGDCYYNGEGVLRDKVEAVKWYTKAAEQGNSDAQNNLAYCYNNGEGVSVDKVEAIKWYSKAANQGDADAMNMIGLIYDEGKGVAENDKEAVKWYTKAAEKGHASAQSNLGLCYKNGEGVAKSRVKAKEWLSKAASQGDESAKETLEEIAQEEEREAEIQRERAPLYKKYKKKHVDMLFEGVICNGMNSGLIMDFFELFPSYGECLPGSYMGVYHLSVWFNGGNDYFMFMKGDIVTDVSKEN